LKTQMWSSICILKWSYGRT